MARDPLPRQRRFITAYYGAANGIGWRAAQAAGYKGDEATLRATASEILTNPNVQAEIAAQNAQITQEGIANKTTRVHAQHERWEKLQAVIAARAEEHDGEAPGSGTGLLVRTYKALGSGELMQIREEWSVDTGLLAEMRQLEAHTAKELGQVIERSEVTGKDGGEIVIRRYIGIDVESA